jgi:hypothetical protein
LLVKMLSDGERVRAIGPREVCQLAREGHLSRIAGHPVSGVKVGYNDGNDMPGVFLEDSDGNRVAALRGREIDVAELEVSDELPSGAALRTHLEPPSPRNGET